MIMHKENEDYLYAHCHENKSFTLPKTGFIYSQNGDMTPSHPAHLATVIVCVLNLNHKFIRMLV